jgi:signal transduction histidine kinase/DNA-binding response OmpR family regulator
MMRRLHLGIALLAVIAAMMAVTVPAQAELAVIDAVRVDPTAENIDLSDALMLLHDPAARLQHAEVRERFGEFRSATRRDLTTGFNAGVYWLRVSLLLPSDSPDVQPEWRWLTVGTPKTQRVVLYVQEGKTLRVLQSGRTVAVRDQPLQTLNPVFPLHLAPGQPLDLLMRVETRGATDMVTSLWLPEAYRHESGKVMMQLAAILGGLLVSGGLSLMVFAALREPQYFWLGLLLFCIAGLEATRSNLFGTYFWPKTLAQPAQALAVFAAGAIFGLSKVVTRLLDLSRQMPRAARLLSILRWCGVAGVLISVISYGHGVRLLSIAGATQNVMVLVLCFLAWRHGQPAARFYLLALSLALLTETARQLANLGLLPWIAAMDFSIFLFLLASPMILFGLIEQTRRLSTQLQVAEQLQQAKSTFLAKISHELRSPLNTVLGFNRMLARESPMLSLAEGTAGIEKSVLRLLHLIDELLDEARAAAGKLTLTLAPLPLQPWLDEITQATRLVLQTRGNRLDCSFLGDLAVTIEADGERLRQVVDNLLANANRHTDRGSIRFECHASRRGEEMVLDFAIVDDGEGIDTERLQTIFDPFERGSPASQLRGKGHGLGLPICRELVQFMSSDITVASTPGKGSRFSFSLRCPLIGVQTEARTARPRLPADSGSTDDRPRALLVDDDPVQLDLLAELLEEDGITVCTAVGGYAAIDRLAEGRWDIVSTDQMMPDGDGWAVLRAVRAKRETLPVVLISSVKPCRPEHLPPDQHFDAALLKPASSEDILSTVWYHLLKVGASATAPDWSALARLSEEGDVSGIADWIAAWPDREHTHPRLLAWIESRLHRLDLTILERFAMLAAQNAGGTSRVPNP